MPKDYSTTKITAYDAFVSTVEDMGFMPLSNNKLNYVNLSDLTVSEQWHTNLPSDPWLWRVRIEEERKAAYAKLLAKKPSFIAREWYPTFLAARRGGRSFSQMYTEGLFSHYAKQIYTLFEQYEALAVHEIKYLAGFTKKTNAKYEAAMKELQMGMFLTIRGTKQKVSAKGEPYGWPSAVYTPVEIWAGEELIEAARHITVEDAQNQILHRVKEVAPGAKATEVKGFVGF